jgi:hypothetical protein
MATTVVQPFHAQREVDPEISEPDRCDGSAEYTGRRDLAAAGIGNKGAGGAREIFEQSRDHAGNGADGDGRHPPIEPLDAAFEAEQQRSEVHYHPAARQSRNSSLIEVLARVPSSTVLTITAQ